MNTLQKILKQDLKCSLEGQKLIDLKKQYVDENRKYKNDEVIYCKQYDSDDEIIKAIILNAKYQDAKIIYTVNKFNKNGSMKKSSKSWRGLMVYHIDERNII